MMRYVQHLLSLTLVPILSTQMSSTMKASIPLRFKSVKGLGERTNDVIYHPSSDDCPTSIVVFFSGDVQDYTENMMAHRDNKSYVKWNLENTAILLHNKFSSSHIFVIRPSRMHLKSFGCYENFVEGNDFGAPTYSITLNSLKHLNLLLKNAMAAVGCNSPTKSDNSENSICSLEQNALPISIIGFSKGCVVLNQLLYSFLALSQQPDKELLEFVECIKVMYWLDGAHCGSSDTWVTDKSVLKNFSYLSVKIRVHVTPYQVHCDMRPRIGKEEKIFREALRRLGADIERHLHFEDKPRSIEYHFRVLEAFTKSD